MTSYIFKTNSVGLCLTEQLKANHLVQNVSVFYETWRFITVFTKLHHSNLLCASWKKFTYANLISLRSVLVLSSTYAWNGLFLQLLCCSVCTVYISHLHANHRTHPSHHHSFDYSNNMGKVRHFRFSQRCCWRFDSSGTWVRVVW